MFRYYISEGAVVDVLGGDLMATPLHWAIREGHLQMVVLLMRCGLVIKIFYFVLICLLDYVYSKYFGNKKFWQRNAL